MGLPSIYSSPAKAGVQVGEAEDRAARAWAPAFAGEQVGGVVNRPSPR